MLFGHLGLPISLCCLVILAARYLCVVWSSRPPDIVVLFGHLGRPISLCCLVILGARYRCVVWSSWPSDIEVLFGHFGRPISLCCLSSWPPVIVLLFVILARYRCVVCHLGRPISFCLGFLVLSSFAYPGIPGKKLLIPGSREILFF